MTRTLLNDPNPETADVLAAIKAGNVYQHSGDRAFNLIRWTDGNDDREPGYERYYLIRDPVYARRIANLWHDDDERGYVEGVEYIPVPLPRDHHYLRAWILNDLRNEGPDRMVFHAPEDVTSVFDRARYTEWQGLGYDHTGDYHQYNPLTYTVRVRDADGTGAVGDVTYQETFNDDDDYQRWLDYIGSDENGGTGRGWTTARWLPLPDEVA